DFERQLERIRLAQVDAIVLWSSAADAGHIVAAMRASGLSQPIFGPERLLSSAFLEGAGRAGEGVVVTSPLDTEETAPSWTRFAEAFRARFSEDPDHFAAYSYDGARILLEAVDRAGLNRALIRDELARLQGFNGVSGPMRFDTTHNNLGKIHVVQVKDGRFVRLAGP
ncbi:MAG: ABC transporter substrate-binding protein, partial [Planctomycetota bacterium]